MRNLNGGTVVGFLALFVALSGASYAAIALPKNSVTTKQVKDRSLLGRDFKRGQLPSGARGPVGPTGQPGPQGPQGAQGPAGPTNLASLTKVSGPQTPVCATGSSCAVASSAATCPAGTRVVTGGFFNFTGGTVGEYSDASSDRTAWTAGVANGSSFGGGNVQAFAYCATSGAAVAAGHRSMTAQTRRDVTQRESRLRAVLAAGTVASQATTPRSYRTCTALNHVYPHGVGRKGARDHTSGTPVTNFKVSNTLYAYNDGKPPRHVGERDLDRDDDGIACEKR